MFLKSITMKRSLFIIVLSLGYFFSISLNAQTLLLDSTTHQTNSNYCMGILYDQGGLYNNYENNTDYWRTICPTSINNNKRLSLSFEEFDIHPSDRVEIYSGNGINGIPYNNANSQPYFTNHDLLNQTIKAYLTDESGCLTVRLITDSSNTSSGFKAILECVDYSQNPVAKLDSFFTKVDPEGNTYNFPIKEIIDTFYYEVNDSYTIKKYYSLDVCKDDSIILRAMPLFPENDIPYHQTPNTCNYIWTFQGGETITVNNNNQVGYRFKDGGHFNLELVIHDPLSNASSTNDIMTKIRVANSPIRHIQEDLKACSSSVFYLSIGKEEDNTVLIGNPQGNSKYRHEETILIPDGPICVNPYLEFPIIIDKFPSSSVINSKDDILSISTNMEHSYIGDLEIKLICPNGQSAILKHYTMNGNADLGIPNTNDGDCYPINNPEGIGWNYCFSNQLLNNPRGVISGNGETTIDSTDIYGQTGYFQTPKQNATIYFGWETTDLNGFEALVGCPLNGDWNIQIFDYWNMNNGYLFSWGIEFTEEGIAGATNIHEIDSVNLIGNNINILGNNRFAIRMPALSTGTVNYGLEIMDEFGCNWDTVIDINVLQGPIVDLGPRDTSIFEPTELSTQYSENYSYSWYPTGDTTNTITTPTIDGCDSIINYYVMVTLMVENYTCMSSDYIQIHNNPTPLTPVQLHAQVNISEEESNILITWLSNALSYEVYRNDILVATPTSRVYVDNTIVEGEDYCYTIRAINNYCESEISEPICKTAIGFNSISENQPKITLYPNPTTSIAQLQIKGLISKAEIQLIDIQGKILKTYIFNPNQPYLDIDLTSLSKGIYNLIINTNENPIVKKIIKE